MYYLFVLISVLLMPSIVCSAAEVKEEIKQTRIVEPGSSSRAIDVKKDEKMSILQSDKGFQNAIRDELKQPSPFSAGISDTVQKDASRLLNSPPAAIATWDILDAWSAWCDTEWHETCEGYEKYTPPEGWDICRYNLVEVSKSDRSASWAITRANAKEIQVYVYSRGSHMPWDRWGSWVRVKLQMVQLVPSSSSEEQRKPLGCSYNNAGGSGQDITELIYCAPDPMNPSSSIGVQICSDYRYDQNGRKYYTREGYPCGVCLR